MHPERPDRVRRRMREAVPLFFHYSGISSLFYLLNRGRKRILTCHNVLPREHSTGALMDGVSHSDVTFTQQVDYLCGRFPCSTDLDDPDAVTITFDDGYINPYEIAHPILARAGVRAYFFVTGSLLRSGQPLISRRWSTKVARRGAGAMRAEA